MSAFGVAGKDTGLSPMQIGSSLTVRREIPTLDGLRALSILCVLAGHWAVMNSVHARLARLGGLGVRVFFVISGFLITTLLQREWEGRRTLNLRTFYFRRTLRIFPPFYAFLLLTALLFSLGAFSSSNPRWWPAFTYSSNLWSVHAWELGHTWSLAIEEQFYLVWPLTFKKLGPTRALRVACAAVISAPVIRLGARAIGHFTSIDLLNQIAATWSVDFLAVGCVLALLPSTSRLYAATRRALASRWTLAAGCTVVAGQLALPLAGRLWVGLDLTVAQSLLALVLGLMIRWCTSHPHSRAGRTLDAMPLRALGIASYSIYLWQQLFFRPTPTLGLVPAVAGTIAAAALSYFFIERPSLRIRALLETRLRLVSGGPSSAVLVPRSTINEAEQ